MKKLHLVLSAGLLIALSAEASWVNYLSSGAPSNSQTEIILATPNVLSFINAKTGLNLSDKQMIQLSKGTGAVKGIAVAAKALFKTCNVTDVSTAQAQLTTCYKAHPEAFNEFSKTVAPLKGLLAPSST